MSVRTRFAPSPTGYLHIGSLRTALYAYAFAKNQHGTFILRIEDTDRNRFVPGSTEKIYDQLKLFGIIWDEGPLVGGPYGPYIQSERVDSGIYRKAAEKLVAQGQAFYCFCKPQTKDEIKKAHENKISQMRDTNCRNLTKVEVDKKITAGEKPAIRLKVPDNEVVSYFDFVVKKEITWKTEYVDDAMLLKSDGIPTYQLGVVVDDVAMEMTHIIRALEWLPSTPIHLLLFKYLGFKTPEIGHLTDILDPAGGKLSKRKGNVSTEDFINAGYLPEAILNFIMLVGWAPKDNREMFTLSEFVENFNPDGLQKANAAFHVEKLNWFNQQYLKKLSLTDLTDKLTDFTDTDKATIIKLLPLVRDRLVTLKDFDNLTDYFFQKPPLTQSLNQEVIKHAADTLEDKFDGKYLEEKARTYCAEKNIKVGDYFMNLRVAITGKSATPPLWDVMLILGKDETMERLEIWLPRKNN
ncbi:glutamate--tRNA ligase [Candidatus Gottesmanbacteria bacterium RIFCSPHIGHO2_01_FULL_42_12]|uniref:Glutamate--tRNA ligase n=1 Tax=Candidatus Gottesmanbacteria bacterium RIFCSPHIGHO2_01_FULL_42_12 TaxID=1798377 RepID=A0A1F5Z1C5_9BACT|nr:MAG: glutamate--tRNA ligase [Candidatus Gottesmanbacteria bacterium RIFCSPHIGHO2_01_FULL_42_12]